MQRLNKVRLVLSSILIITSLTGCNSDKLKTPVSNQPTVTFTTTPLQTIKTDVTPSVEETVWEVDPAVLDNLVGIWKVKEFKQEDTLKMTSEMVQSGIFNQDDENSYLLFEKNGDMFYFGLESRFEKDGQSCLATNLFPDEKRLYKISDKYIEINAKYVKVRYEYKLNDDKLTLKNNEINASFVRDDKVATKHNEELQRMIKRYKNNWKD